MIRLNEATLKRSEFLELWKEEMTLNMRRMNPDWDEDDIDKVLDKMLLEQMMLNWIIIIQPSIKKRPL